MSSIRLVLLKWLIAPLLVLNISGAALTYWLAWVPAQVAFDQSLADAAWALIPHLRMVGSRIETDLSNQAEEVL
ncbi:MAG: sensor histidine kinase N-terminal domain-containing protein, partial [Bacillota bacterium]